MGLIEAVAAMAVIAMVSVSALAAAAAGSAATRNASDALLRIQAADAALREIAASRESFDMCIELGTVQLSGHEMTCDIDVPSAGLARVTAQHSPAGEPLVTYVRLP